MIQRKVKTDIFAEAVQIADLLLKASDAYYNDAESIITDMEYDQKKDYLRDLYHTQLLPKKSVNSDAVKKVEKCLNQIGAPVQASEWKKYQHKIPMTSLNKVNSESEFSKWESEIRDQFYVIMEKLDGISLDLEYEQGKLIRAITRGDGLEGEEITQNVRKMQNVKEKIEGFNGNLRGEILLTSDKFNEINNEILNEGGKELKNLRNAASGVSKRLDSKHSEKLSVFFYDCFTDEEEFQNFSDKLSFLENHLKVKTCFWKKGIPSELVKIYNEYQKEKRVTLNHWIDGLVIICDKIELIEKFGELGGNPKAKIAWKFPSVIVKTKVIDIRWNVGNSRRITPVAIIEPVSICGVTITNVNIYNLSNFLKLNLYKGCEVLVKRSNDVIPVLEGLV